VREEVKRFLSDPDRGRPRPQLFSHDAETSCTIIQQERSYIDLERHADDETGSPTKRNGQSDDAQGRMVDVVLSDMSAPWEQTTGFWKKTLSNPYIRMMNTSGINFRDHAGSMVRQSYELFTFIVD
jgi:21S rRNA (uridine2791-2'-O)-methyltransferase